jgi:hypothetical protein
LDLPLKEVILLQTAFEILLAMLLAFLLWRAWKRPAQSPGAAVPEELSATIERFVSESERLAEVFSKNLEDRLALSKDLILKLDRRLTSYRELLAETEAAMARSFSELERIRKEGGMLPPAAQPASDLTANPAAPEVRALVLKLRKEGLAVEEIAVRARLHRGEVELILEMERQFDI